MQNMKKFSDRRQAGKVLAKQLAIYANKSEVIVLALPRGGVPVAYEIAKALTAPLDVLIVRKLGVPGHEELAMGAIATGGITIFNEEIIQDLNLSKASIDQVIQAEYQELQRRESIYRGDHPFPILTHKIIILVDDGVATGATMNAAIIALRQRKPTKIIVAVPVAADDTGKKLAVLADDLVCLVKQSPFYSVGASYIDFSQTTDTEVCALLAKQSQSSLRSAPR